MKFTNLLVNAFIFLYCSLEVDAATMTGLLPHSVAGQSEAACSQAQSPAIPAKPFAAGDSSPATDSPLIASAEAPASAASQRWIIDKKLAIISPPIARDDFHQIKNQKFVNILWLSSSMYNVATEVALEPAHIVYDSFLYEPLDSKSSLPSVLPSPKIYALCERLETAMHRDGKAAICCDDGYRSSLLAAAYLVRFYLPYKLNFSLVPDKAQQIKLTVVHAVKIVEAALPGYTMQAHIKDFLIKFYEYIP
jgi:hypothetical protein